ncbi:hypothetical protein [Zobellia laminariae]|uniref:hypothetical protein n=1 Tax=Zobellia laminariae TaxID=248906 RepID=UPI0026F46355|nr:hypothetical protein [Zobellia laminariae]WKX74840.1 hypothetical protein Q5W13_13650 [Zobellia laminariae]
MTVNVADGTYLYGQPAELEISQGATIDPLPTAERDFTDPTPYMVTSENGTEQEWIVNVNVSPPTGSGDNAITGFALPVQNSADIDTGNNTITVNVPDGTILNVAPQLLQVSLCGLPFHRQSMNYRILVHRCSIPSRRKTGQNRYGL